MRSPRWCAVMAGQTPAVAAHARQNPPPLRFGSLRPCFVLRCGLRRERPRTAPALGRRARALRTLACCRCWRSSRSPLTSWWAPAWAPWWAVPMWPAVLRGELAALVRQADWAAIPGRPAGPRAPGLRRRGRPACALAHRVRAAAEHRRDPAQRRGRQQPARSHPQRPVAGRARRDAAAGLPVPFRAVATDLLSGDMVTQDQTRCSRPCAPRWRCRACSRRCASTAGRWWMAGWCTNLPSTWRASWAPDHHRRQCRRRRCWKSAS